MDEDLAGRVAWERRADAARTRAWAREAARQRGVAWSGLGPDGPRPRGDGRLAADAARRLAALARWRDGPAGRLTAALGAAQRAAEAVHAAAEAVRAGLARDPDAPPALEPLERGVADLETAVAGVRAAGAELARPTGLSGP